MTSTEYVISRFNEYNLKLIILISFLMKGKGIGFYDKFSSIKIIKSINYHHDLIEIKKFSSNGHIIHGFSGVEASLDYAETILNNIFPRHSNNPNNTCYRADKYWMNEVLRLNKISSIPQVNISSDLSLTEKISAVEISIWIMVRMLL